MKIRQVEGYRNYDKSEFAKPSALNDDDAVLESLYKKLHSLAEFNGPSNYKSYADLKTKLMQVLGQDGMAMSTAEHVSLDVTEEPAPLKQQVAAATTADDSEDDTLSYFNQLALDS